MARAWSCHTGIEPAELPQVPVRNRSDSTEPRPLRSPCCETGFALSRHLSPGEVWQLINAVYDDNALGRRNRAMLLLMAQLGLRPKEVVAIRLDDINWAAGEIVVRGKGGHHDRMPLPADVGEAIVA